VEVAAHIYDAVLYPLAKDLGFAGRGELLGEQPRWYYNAAQATPPRDRRETRAQRESREEMGDAEFRPPSSRELQNWLSAIGSAVRHLLDRRWEVLFGHRDGLQDRPR